MFSVSNEAGSARPLKVVSISHTAVVRGTGRLRYEPIQASPDIDLTLIVPKRWKEYGRAMPADPPAGLNIRAEQTVLTAAGPAKWYFHFYPALGAALKELAPDVIHLWEEPWSCVALQALVLRDLLAPRAGVVLETDQNILRRLPPPFEQIRRYTLRRTDALIVRQPEALEVARVCGYAGPAVQVEYCVDTELFRPKEAARAHRPPGLTVGYVGRLVPEKGLGAVIEALHRCGGGVRLLVLGEGPEKPALEAQIAALALGDRVQFLPPRSPAGVAEFLGGIDVLVLMSRTTPSWKEQFGRVIIEAQACGVPVIGSNSGAIPSVIADGGWIVPEDDSAALARLLDRLAANPAEVAGAARAAEKQRSRFSREAVASDLRRAFELACRRRRGEAEPNAGGLPLPAGAGLLS